MFSEGVRRRFSGPAVLENFLTFFYKNTNFSEMGTFLELSCLSRILIYKTFLDFRTMQNISNKLFLSWIAPSWIKKCKTNKV